MQQDEIEERLIDLFWRLKPDRRAAFLAEMAEECCAACGQAAELCLCAAELE